MSAFVVVVPNLGEAMMNGLLSRELFFAKSKRVRIVLDISEGH